MNHMHTQGDTLTRSEQRRATADDLYPRVENLLNAIKAASEEADALDAELLPGCSEAFDSLERAHKQMSRALDAISSGEWEG
jgi:hypothetical protein